MAILYQTMFNVQKTKLLLKFSKISDSKISLKIFLKYFTGQTSYFILKVILFLSQYVNFIKCIKFEGFK